MNHNKPCARSLLLRENLNLGSAKKLAKIVRMLLQNPSIHWRRMSESFTAGASLIFILSILNSR